MNHTVGGWCMYSGQRKRKGGREGGSVSNDESCTVNDDSLKSHAWWVVKVAFASDFRGASLWSEEIAELWGRDCSGIETINFLGARGFLS